MEEDKIKENEEIKDDEWFLKNKCGLDDKTEEYINITEDDVVVIEIDN